MGPGPLPGLEPLLYTNCLKNLKMKCINSAQLTTSNITAEKWYILSIPSAKAYYNQSFPKITLVEPELESLTQQCLCHNVCHILWEVIYL